MLQSFKKNSSRQTKIMLRCNNNKMPVHTHSRTHTYTSGNKHTVPPCLREKRGVTLNLHSIDNSFWAVVFSFFGREKKHIRVLVFVFYVNFVIPNLRTFILSI